MSKIGLHISGCLNEFVWPSKAGLPIICGWTTDEKRVKYTLEIHSAHTHVTSFASGHLLLFLNTTSSWHLSLELCWLSLSNSPSILTWSPDVIVLRVHCYCPQLATYHTQLPFIDPLEIKNSRFSLPPLWMIAQTMPTFLPVQKVCKTREQYLPSAQYSEAQRRFNHSVTLDISNQLQCLFLIKFN